MLRRLILASLFTLSAGTAMADDRKADPDAVEFFESKVRPVLVEHCYKCHSAQAKAPKGGLRLDSLDGMKKGGDTGPAIVPGDADASLLVQAVRYQDEQTQMPPKGKLTEATIATLEQWVRGGAVMPHGVEAAAVKARARSPPGIDFEAARSHWAYQPIRKPAIPARDACGLAELSGQLVRPRPARVRGSDAVAAGRSADPAPPGLPST